MYKFNVFLVLSFLFIHGCGQETTPKKDFNREEEVIPIRVIVHDSQAELNRRKEEYAIHEDVYGFAVWNASGKGLCEVHLTKKKFNSTLAHEIKHCLYGQFHN